MNLWIRSQDKEDLVECKNIGLAYLGKYGFVDKIGDIERKKFYICEFTDTTHTTLGKYETKERALEVLDEIQNILFPKFKIDTSSIKENGHSWVENGVILQKYTANVDYIKLNTYVYEMPKE